MMLQHPVSGISKRPMESHRRCPNVHRLSADRGPNRLISRACESMLAPPLSLQCDQRAKSGSHGSTGIQYMKHPAAGTKKFCMDVLRHPQGLLSLHNLRPRSCIICLLSPCDNGQDLHGQDLTTQSTKQAKSKAGTRIQAGHSALAARSWCEHSWHCIKYIIHVHTTHITCIALHGIASCKVGMRVVVRL